MLAARLERLTLRKAWLFTLLALWIGLEHVALGPASYVDIHDSGDGTLPLLMAACPNALKHGLTYWLPWTTCGVDRLGNDLSFVHLQAWLFALLPGWLAYQSLLLLHYFLCGYFAYRLSRDRFEMSEEAGMLAGALSAVSTKFMLGYQLGFAAVPMALWALEGSALGLVGATGLGCLYGFGSSMAATLPYCLSALAFWFVAVRPQRTLAFWLRFAAFSTASLVWHLPTAWALVSSAAASHRAEWQAAALPFGGALKAALASVLDFKLCVALGLAGLVVSRGRVRLSRSLLLFFVGAVAGIAILSVAKDRLGSALGVLRGFQVSRLAELLPLAAALAGAAGFDVLPKKKMAATLALACLLAVSLETKYHNVALWLYEGSYAANYESPVIRSLARFKKDGLFRVATFQYVIHPAYAQAYGLETVDGYINLYPKRYHAFWSKVIEPLTSRDARVYDYFSQWGSRIYLFPDGAEHDAAPLRLGRYARGNLLSLANTRFIISRDPLIDADLAPLISPRLWGSLSGRERLVARLRDNFFGRTDLYVYENMAYLPRAFMTPTVRLFETVDDIWVAMAGATMNELKDSAFLLRSDAPVGAAGHQKASVSVDAYRPDRLDLSVLSDGPGMLVVSNNFSAYWKCLVDGVPAEVVPAYGAFMGVFVDKKARKVTFSYAPPYIMFRSDMEIQKWLKKIFS